MEQEVLTQRIESQKLQAAIAMLKVISHPIRLAVVDLLTAKGKCTILEIQETLGLEQAIASQHISLMENKGVLLAERIGRHKYVSLRFPKMQNIVNCLEQCCGDNF
jgi:DNA-binding transcriptional ArsR family regulator